jgi:hypothetical protein
MPLDDAGTNSPTVPFIFVKAHNICHVPVMVKVLNLHAKCKNE